MLVVQSPVVVPEHFAGVAEHQEVGVFITVTHVLLRRLVVGVFLGGSATKHLPGKLVKTKYDEVQGPPEAVVMLLESRRLAGAP